MRTNIILRSGLLIGGLIAVAALTVLASGLLGASADSGGPSDGYTWYDNNDPGPKVGFTPVSIVNPSVALGGDDEFATVDLGFTFNFFGQEYTQVDVSTNGFLSFDIGNDCNDNYNDADGDNGNTIPVVGDCDDTEWGGEPLIAAWFDDLDADECGAILASTQGEAPGRVFIARYLDICHNDCDSCDAGDGVSFDVILFEGSNDVKIQYEDTFFEDGEEDITEENRGGTATVGISNGAEGLQYSANSTALTDGLAVLFTTGGEPTTAPVPVTGVPGDVDCNGVVNADDALKVLLFTGGLDYAQEPGCPPIGTGN